MYTDLNYQGEEITVFFDYEKGEDQTYDYCGSPPRITIKEVLHNTQEVDEEQIKELIIEIMER